MYSLYQKNNIMKQRGYIMNFDHMNNEALIKTLGERIQQKRLNKNLSQEDLAKKAGVSRRAIYLLESGHSTTMSTFLNILRGLNALAELDSFLPQPKQSPIQLAKLEGRTRQRASGVRKNSHHG